MRPHYFKASQETHIRLFPQMIFMIEYFKMDGVWIILHIFLIYQATHYLKINMQQNLLVLNFYSNLIPDFKAGNIINKTNIPLYLNEQFCLNAKI